MPGVFKQPAMSNRTANTGIMPMALGPVYSGQDQTPSAQRSQNYSIAAGHDPIHP